MLINLPKTRMLSISGKPRASTRGDGKRRYVRDSKRRKVPGGYGIHRKKAPLVREQLFEWFSMLRHSWDCQIKSRIPPSMVLLKAKEFIHDYVVACMRAGKDPDVPVVTGHWLKEWQMEYGVNFRRPNRKYAVPRKVLEQRLSIFWTNLIRVRHLAQLVLGYDLEMFNLDQSPFHMNESGRPGFYFASIARSS
jgi:hypothetical protein